MNGVFRMYVLTLLLLGAWTSATYAQGTRRSDDALELRIQEIEDELFALEEMDQRRMTRADKKAWKAERKLLRRKLQAAYARLDGGFSRNGYWASRSPYFNRFGWGTYDPYWGYGYGYAPFYRRNVVVLRSNNNCVVPSQARVNNTPNRVVRPRTVAPRSTTSRSYRSTAPRTTTRVRSRR